MSNVCFHNWSKWSELSEEVWRRPNGVEYTRMLQKRNCLKCNAIELREVRAR